MQDKAKALADAIDSEYDSFQLLLFRKRSQKPVSPGVAIILL